MTEARQIDKGLTEKGGRAFWLLLERAKKLYVEDCFLLRSAILCKLCFKEVKPGRRLPNYRQHAFIILAMDSHIKGHIRRGEITEQSISQAEGKG